MRTIDRFTTPEQEMLENAPLLCFMMICLQDGKISKLELNAVNHILYERSSQSGVDDELYKQVMDRIASNANAAIDRVGQLPGGAAGADQYLYSVSLLLDKAPPDQATNFKETLVSDTTWIAQNSKMFSSKVTNIEASIISRIQRAFGLTAHVI